MYKNPLHAIRHRNLKDLIQQHYNGSQSALALAIERTPGMVSQWLSGHRKMGEKAARSIEQQLSLPNRALDTPNIDLTAEQINLNDLESLLLRVNRDLKSMEAHINKTTPTNTKALSATMDARAAVAKLRLILDTPPEEKS